MNALIKNTEYSSVYFRWGFASALIALCVGVLVSSAELPIVALVFAAVLMLVLAYTRPDLVLTLFFCGIVLLTDSAHSAVGGYVAIRDIDVIQGLPSLVETLFLLIVGTTAIRLVVMERDQWPFPWRLSLVYGFIVFLALLTGLVRGCTMDLIRVDLVSMLFPVLCFAICFVLLNSSERVERLFLALTVICVFKASLLSVAFMAGHGWPFGSDKVVTTDSADLLAFITVGLVLLNQLVSGKLKGNRAMLAGVSCMPIAFAVVFSYRRAQWIGSVFALGLLFLGLSSLARRRIIGLLLFGMLMAGAVGVFFSRTRADNTISIATRLTSIVDKKQSSNRYHFLESRQVLKDLEKSPLLGLGLGSHHTPLTLYEDDLVPTNIVHNTFLYIWMKIGLLGLLFFLWSMRNYARIIIKLRHAETTGLLLPLAASSGLWLTMFLTGPVPWYFHQSSLIALFATMTLALIRHGEQQEDQFLSREPQ